MEAVLIPAGVKDGAVKLSLILPVCEEIESQLRGSSHVITLFLIKHNFSICNCTGRSNPTNRNDSLTATFVNVIHNKLVGEDAGQVKRTRGFDFLLDVRGF